MYYFDKAFNELDEPAYFPAIPLRVSKYNILLLMLICSFDTRQHETLIYWKLFNLDKVPLCRI
jgi:hypothetical protein